MNQPRNRKHENEWIAEVSHELRLPLANIKLLVDTLLDGALEDRQVALRMLERTQREVERLETLVRDLLSLEDIKDRSDELKLQRVNLLESAMYAIESTKDMAARKNIAIEYFIPESFTVDANPDQLKQVVLNLLENAIKYTPEGGRVALRAIEPGVFSVEDNGIGIESSEISKIFKRFYRVDRASEPGSTGLGLSIVKHIADLHGAKINVRSKLGDGSCFTLQFPERHSAISGGLDVGK